MERRGGGGREARRLPCRSEHVPPSLCRLCSLPLRDFCLFVFKKPACLALGPPAGCRDLCAQGRCELCLLLLAKEGLHCTTASFAPLSLFFSALLRCARSWQGTARHGTARQRLLTGIGGKRGGRPAPSAGGEGRLSVAGSASPGGTNKAALPRARPHARPFAGQAPPPSPFLPGRRACLLLLLLLQMWAPAASPAS